MKKTLYLTIVLLLVPLAWARVTVADDVFSPAVVQQIDTQIGSLKGKLYVMRKDPKWESLYWLSKTQELTRKRPYSNTNVLTNQNYGGGIQDTTVFLGVDGLGVALRPKHFIELSDFYYSLLSYCAAVKAKPDLLTNKRVADYYALLKLIQIDYKAVASRNYVGPFDAPDITALDSIHTDFYQLLDLLSQG